MKTENSIEVNYKLLMQEIDALETIEGYELKIGAAKIKLRIYSNKLYCDLPGLYVGEINASRLTALYFGLTGQTLLPLIKSV